MKPLKPRILIGVINVNESIWAATAKLPAFPALQQDIRTDVLVIGGGLAGLLTAYQLRKSGTNCVLIEADRICRGVSGNTTAKLTSQHGLIYHRLLRRLGPEGAGLYFRANQQALEEYRRLAGEIDCDFSRKDNYIYSSRSPDALEQEAQALQQLGIQSDYVNQIDLPVPSFGAIRFRDQAQFHPLKLAAGIVDGLEIYEHSPAVQFSGNTVQTSQGNIRAEKIVIATHFPLLNKHGAYFLKLYQDRSYVLALENAPLPEGMYLDEAAGGLSFRGCGSHLLLGGGAHRTGKAGSAWAGLEAFAQAAYPQARIRYRWAAQDCMGLDGMPYIGQYSRRTPDLYVATGFHKWGMTSSMAASLLLRDLILGRENPCSALFSPSRSMLRPQLFVNAWESTLNLLTPTAPRCPHLGCALKWNPQEHSWDCPCHGSRFGPDGKLLDNPATGDLKHPQDT